MRLVLILMNIIYLTFQKHKVELLFSLVPVIFPQYIIYRCIQCIQQTWVNIMSEWVFRRKDPLKPQTVLGGFLMSRFPPTLPPWDRWDNPSRWNRNSERAGDAHSPQGHTANTGCFHFTPAGCRGDPALLGGTTKAFQRSLWSAHKAPCICMQITLLTFHRWHHPGSCACLCMRHVWTRAKVAQLLCECGVRCIQGSIWFFSAKQFKKGEMFLSGLGGRQSL